MNVTASMAFRLVPDFLRTQPVFLCIDDTIVPKSETKFEDVSVLFDHAAHRGSSYLNGHCFVSLMLCVPVWKKDKISWLSVPLGYRMWTKQKSKLELAADMIRQVMPECQKQKNVILLCDSWYMKKPLVSIPEEYPNLDMIGNVRADSILYNLPPERTGRKGRPAGHGKQLSIETDFIFSDKKIDGYFIAVRPVVTNLFGNRSGIERMVNLINIAYCAMKILPYQATDIFCRFRENSRKRYKITTYPQSFKTIDLPSGISSIKWCIFILSCLKPVSCYIPDI